MNPIDPRRLVLLVENDPTHQVFARNMIETMGYLVHSAASGQRALEAISLESYDIVLLDCEMPGLNGFETAKRIREHESRLGSPLVPIVGTTGDGKANIHRLCFDSGMNDCLVKPFTRDGLRAMLGKWQTASTGRISWNCLESLTQKVSEQTVCEICRDFESKLDTAIEQFKSLFEAQNWDSFRDLSNKIKASAQQVGANHLAKLCSEAEIQVGSRGNVGLKALHELVKNCNLTLYELRNRTKFK